MTAPPATVTAEQWERVLERHRPTSDPGRLRDLRQLGADLRDTRRAGGLTLRQAAFALSLTLRRLVALERHPQGNDGRYGCGLAQPITDDEERRVRAWIGAAPASTAQEPTT